MTGRHRLEGEWRTEQDVLREMYRITADRAVDFETKLQRLFDLGREFLDVSYGFVTEITNDTQQVIGARGDHDQLRPGRSCPLSEAYCQKTITRDDLVTVQNAVAEGWEGDPAYEQFELGWYIGANVIVDDLSGTFCFAGTEPQEVAFSEMQLLENLLQNPIEHGGSDVTITVGCLDDSFYVEDDGRGIPEPKRKRVFETGYTTHHQS